MTAVVAMVAALCGQYSPIQAYRTDTYEMLYLGAEQLIYKTTKTPFSSTGCWCAMCMGNGSSGYSSSTYCVNAPTPMERLEHAFSSIALNRNDVLFDLGCGDGRACLIAAKEFGARAVGLDNRSDAVRLSQANSRRNGLDDLCIFYERDIHRTSLEHATVVYAHLFTSDLIALDNKIRVQRRYPNIRCVVTYKHPWPSQSVHIGQEMYVLTLKGTPPVSATASSGPYILRVWTADWCVWCQSEEWQNTLRRFSESPDVWLEEKNYDRYRGWCSKNGITQVPYVELFEGEGESAKRIGSAAGVQTYEQLASLLRQGR